METAMGQPAAKQGDRITAPDMHLIQPPSSAPPSLAPHQFNGGIDGNVSDNVRIDGQRAATVGSTARNEPPHAPQGGTFVNPPSNQGQIVQGSSTVLINRKAAARIGDKALTCNDQPGPPVGTVVAAGGTCSVMIG
jgi:uncharacterized Zn-binding protein involved in type VI secretion